MVRRLAFVLILVGGGAAGITAGCKGDASRTAEVVPGKRAGVVREVTGTVTAVRPGAAPRPLTAGDEVSGDDEIATGADGSVLIELDHNHVTFTLPAGRTQRVGASLAWSQPMATAAKRTDEHSAAAGRAIERSAVDTAASSGAPGAAPPAAQAAPSLEQAAPAPAQAVEANRAADPEPTAAAPRPAPARKRALEEQAPPKPAPSPAPAPAPAIDSLGVTGGGGNDKASKGAPTTESMHAPSAPMTPTADDVDSDAPPPPPSYTVSLAIKGALAKATVAASITDAVVTGCWQATSSPATTATIEIIDLGTIGRVSSSDAAVADCLKKKLAGVSFAKQAKPTTVTITVKR
jgi:hypothetical protein